MRGIEGARDGGDGLAMGEGRALRRELRRGEGLFRYVAPDDFGVPETSFTICMFWYIDALAAISTLVSTT